MEQKTGKKVCVFKIIALELGNANYHNLEQDTTMILNFNKADIFEIISHEGEKKI